jgi:hypothetical protein
MQRTQISLTDADRALLDRQSSETGLSISALIRNAVQQSYGSIHDLTNDLDLLRSAFGGWTDQRESGEGYVENLRQGTRLDQMFS